MGNSPFSSCPTPCQRIYSSPLHCTRPTPKYKACAPSITAGRRIASTEHLAISGRARHFAALTGASETKRMTCTTSAKGRQRQHSLSSLAWWSRRVEHRTECCAGPIERSPHPSTWPGRGSRTQAAVRNRSYKAHLPHRHFRPPSPMAYASENAGPATGSTVQARVERHHGITGCLYCTRICRNTKSPEESLGSRLHQNAHRLRQCSPNPRAPHTKTGCHNRKEVLCSSVCTTLAVMLPAIIPRV
jgi:hypothetical protein